MNDRRIVLILSLIFIVMLAFTIVPHKTEIAHLSDQQFYSELIAIDGIGPTLAQRAVDYRHINPTAKPADYIGVKGIGERKVGQIKKRFK